jgi:hypothetical protein
VTSRKTFSIASIVAVAAIALSTPAGASAGVVDDLLNGVKDTVNNLQNTVNGVTGGGGGGAAAPGGSAPAPQATTPTTQAGATDTPPIDGTDPHGQGTVLDTDVNTPLTPNEEDVLLGQARGEQDADGNYRGEITLLSVLGIGVGGFETQEGETVESPLQPVNDVLDQICTASDVCLSVLDFRSETTDKGSVNSFSVANADVLGGVLSTGLVQSNGYIGETNRCQTAHGDSSVASLGALSGTLDLAALQSSSDSTACRGEAPETGSSSTVANLNGTGVLELLGCSETEVDDAFGVPLLLEGFCNADDTNAGQTDDPYNVRQALNLDVLPGLNLLGLTGGLAGLDASGSESHAQAPDAAGPECPDPTNPDCPQPPGPECPDPTNPDCPGPGEPGGPDGPGGPGGPDGPGGPGGPSADGPGAEKLPFTGADMGVMGLIGVAVMGLGLLGMALADRRRRLARR